MDSDLLCQICMERLTIPVSFKNSPKQCSQNHFFCVECIYEYLRYRYQISSFDGKCLCPSDRNEYFLENEEPISLLNIFEINTDIMKKLDEKEELVCNLCHNTQKIMRKDYYEHWKHNHFGKDEDLLIIKENRISKKDDYFDLLPPEFLTEEELENQRMILEQFSQDKISREIRRIRLLNPQDKEQRIVVLNRWKELWEKSKQLKVKIKDKKFDWDSLYQLIIKDTEDNQKKTNELFLIYTIPERQRNRNFMYSIKEGNLSEYLEYLNKKRKGIIELEEQKKKEKFMEHMRLVNENLAKKRLKRKMNKEKNLKF
jgi:hypothetical protein